MNSLKSGFSAIIIGAFAGIIIFSLAGGTWSYERKSNNASRVRIDVTPMQLSSGKSVKFEVRMNTHSVDLSYDMVAAAVLKDDHGRTYQPLRWDGSSAGGHHRSGVLEFSPLSDGAKAVTLYLKNISGVAERVFEWKVEP